MALDLQAESLLKALEAMGPPPEGQISVEAARKSFEALAPIGAGPPVEVDSVVETTIPGPKRDILLRIYWPMERERCVGAAVFFHGGGFVLGSLNSFDSLARRLAKESSAVIVSVEYSLAPEYKFPVAVEEAYLATSWVGESLDELMGRSGCAMGVIGDSAGANLAATTALLIRDRQGPELAFQLLAYPPTNFDENVKSIEENAKGYLLTKETLAWFVEQYLGEEDDPSNPLISPVHASLQLLPPAAIITAHYDPLRDMGEMYCRLLEASGVTVEHWPYPGMIHGFLNFMAFIDEANSAVERCGKYMHRMLTQPD